MEQKINIDNLDDLQKQALVCMYYAMLPKTDARYKKRMHDWEVLEKRFGTKKTTYKHAKDAFDFYFPNNGRKGWSDDRDLKRRGHAYQEVFELYKDYSADQLEKAVAEIIHGYENEEPTFVSMKCGFPDTVHNILNGNKDINVAAVFGEVFQLLDRDDRNASQYPVKPSEDIKAYLAKELGGRPEQYDEIKIPDNMYIWSTMNSADQGVFPMDTAFKRRWNFEYIGINHKEEKIKDTYLVCDKAQVPYRVDWNELRKAINTTLASRDYKINEDKLMGPFFVSKSILENEEAFRETFKSKIIMYLFEDAAKQRRHMLFGGCDEDIRNQYSTICEEFDKRGIDIFCKEIRDKIKKEYLSELE